REFTVLDFVDVLPGILGERYMGSALSCVDAGNTGCNGHSVVVVAADQNAADLGLHGRARMLTNFPRYFGLHDDGGCLNSCFRFRHQPAAPAASWPSTARSSPASKYATSRSPARARNTSKMGNPSWSSVRPPNGSVPE